MNAVRLIDTYSTRADCPKFSVQFSANAEEISRIVMDKQVMVSWVILPEAKPMEVPATQLHESLLSQILQVVRSFIINHHGQDLPGFYLVYILGQPSALVLAPICVKPTHTHVKVGHRD